MMQGTLALQVLSLISVTICDISDESCKKEIESSLESAKAYKLMRESTGNNFIKNNVCPKQLWMGHGQPGDGKLEYRMVFVEKKTHNGTDEYWCAKVTTSIGNDLGNFLGKSRNMRMLK